MDKLSRRSFVKMAGLVAAAAVMPGCSSDEIKKAEGKEEELAKAEPGTGGDHYEAPQGRQGGESVVYFTRDLSAAGLLKLYEKIAPNITGRVGIKLYTGEPHGPNIIPRPWVKELIAKDLPEAKIVETNTYYQGDRYTTEQHRKTLAINGWDFAPVDIMDESGTAMLPVKGGKWFTEMSVGAHLLDYDSLLVLTHFKGHTMGGFGGSNKNIGIGCADGRIGKKMIHAGSESEQWAMSKEMLMERITESSKATVDHFGDHIAYTMCCATCRWTATVRARRLRSQRCRTSASWLQPISSPSTRLPSTSSTRCRSTTVMTSSSAWRRATACASSAT